MQKGKSSNYQDLYDRVGRLTGWDFSRLKVSSSGEKWDFYKEVIKKAGKSSLLLDIGTGGGERILKIAQNFLLIVGVDLSISMIGTAKKNLQKSQSANVRFFQMDARSIAFPNSFFDVISCRHSPFFADEVYRLIRKGGYFLSQQVSEHDKLNIKQAFGRGQKFGEKDGKAMQSYVKNLKKAGFSEIRTFNYDAVELYKTPDDLIFLLRNTPIIDDFGKQPKDFEILSAFIEQNTETKGIRTNSKRYLIVAKK